VNEWTAIRGSGLDETNSFLRRACAGEEGIASTLLQGGGMIRGMLRREEVQKMEQEK
jgi:hypothetical protein